MGESCPFIFSVRKPPGLRAGEGEGADAVGPQGCCGNWFWELEGKQGGSASTWAWYRQEPVRPGRWGQ